MESRNRRELRYRQACSSLPNFFRPAALSPTPWQDLLPPDVYQKLQAFPTLTCEQINALAFTQTEPFPDALTLMREAGASQQREIGKSNGAGEAGQWKNGTAMTSSDIRCGPGGQGQMSLHCEEELLNHPCFKTELQDLFLE